jgi:hypothetical protein
MGRSVRYSLQALEEFKRANARGSTSEYEGCPGPGRPARRNVRTFDPRSSLPPVPGLRLSVVDAPPRSPPRRAEAFGSIETTGINGNVDKSI